MFRECDIFIADFTGTGHNVMIEAGDALKHGVVAK